MKNTDRSPPVYLASMVNITNKCNLRCRHCFVFREGNPNEPKKEMDSKTMLEKLEQLQKRHQIHTMVWMGGEPLLRPDVLREGLKLFPRNHVTTNGTIDLIELPNCIYVLSIDGPPELSDAIRGEGVFDRVLNMVARVPETFGPTVMAQCVVTKTNEDTTGTLTVIWGVAEREDHRDRAVAWYRELLEKLGASVKPVEVVASHS